MNFLPLRVQENLFLAEHIFFVFSIPLSILSLTFLIKQTPPNQATIRNYLILVQASKSKIEE